MAKAKTPQEIAEQLVQINPGNERVIRFTLGAGIGTLLMDLPPDWHPTAVAQTVDAIRAAIVEGIRRAPPPKVADERGNPFEPKGDWRYYQ